MAPKIVLQGFSLIAFTVSKTQGGKPEASNTSLIKLETIYDRVKLVIVQIGEEVKFYTHVAVTMPQDRSLHCKIWGYG